MPDVQGLLAARTPHTINIGGSVQSKAVDATYKIVEQDFGFTNMKDNMREGDIAAPSLPPALQKVANNFWSGGAGYLPQRAAGS